MSKKGASTTRLCRPESETGTGTGTGSEPLANHWPLRQFVGRVGARGGGFPLGRHKAFADLIVGSGHRALRSNGPIDEM